MKTLEQLASTAEEWISSRYGVVRGHPEWRALVEAFEAGQASARAACRAEALEEAAQDKADAAAYRWLRDHGNPSNDPINPQRGLTLAVDGAVKLHMVFWCTREQLDDAIAAAIREMK